jgi:hypothetical protein
LSFPEALIISDDNGAVLDLDAFQVFGEVLFIDVGADVEAWTVSDMVSELVEEGLFGGFDEEVDVDAFEAFEGVEELIAFGHDTFEPAFIVVGEVVDAAGIEIGLVAGGDE